MDDHIVPEPRPAPMKRRERGLDTLPQQQEPNWDGWNNWLDTRVAAALDKFSEAYSDELIKVVFSRMDKHREAAVTEITQLKAELSEMRGELRLARELLLGKVAPMRKPDAA
jgi:hypothetical protein